MSAMFRKATQLLADQNGAVTIEFTTLVPAFLLLMMFFVDSSVLFLSDSEMYSTARDIARRMSTGQLKTAQQVRDYAAQHLFLGERTYYVEPVFGENMQCRIAVQIGDAVVFGAFFKPILGRWLIATAVTSQEPRVIPAPST